MSDTWTPEPEYPTRDAARAAGHRPVEMRELGYARQVCATCRSDWPCSGYAQAAEDEDDAAAAALDW